MNEQRVLLVEDESAIADTVQYALETDSFSTIWVASGAEALLQLEQQPFQFLILDVGLPDINGFDLFRQIHQNNSIPTLFLTARSEEIDRVVGLEIGADDYVTKPFSPRELVARVKAILRRTQLSQLPTTKPETKQVIKPEIRQDQKTGTFELDREQACIRLQGQVLVLTKSEFLILSTLIQQPGRVFSRGQLMEAIWHSPHPSEERAIDTHIKVLRAKLRQIEADNEAIQTHRGLGYSLIIR